MNNSAKDRGMTGSTPSPLPLSLYAIGLGSNQRHARYGDPRGVLLAAFEALDCDGVDLLDASSIIASDPIGPSKRRYANAAALVATHMTPPELLRHLKDIESQFGKRRGQRWSSRVLDLDILLWSEGIWADSHLIIPHKEMVKRNFVLSPLAEIAPKWRHPLRQQHIFQILSRLQRSYPVDQRANSH